MGHQRGRIKVLSIVGAGRSGTTVLASILGEIDGFASAGELRWLWERGIVEQRPCACGQPPARCPVWSAVIPRALPPLADGTAATPQQIVDAQREVSRRGNVLRALRAAGSPSRAQRWPAFDRLRAATGAATAAFADQTGARLVVDTSKRPQDAAVFASLGDLDHYVLHLVRDPRAVAHSWRRTKTFEAAGGTRTMGTRSLPATVRRWVSNALSTQVLRRQLPAARWLEMRYEDFCRDPRRAIDQIVGLLGEDGRPPFEDDHTAVLCPSHIVAGNPSRFVTGSVTIRADEEWRRGMPRRDQWMVQLATWPLMVRYGYGRWSSR